MGDRRSKEYYVHQISTSIYVTNFPEQFSYRDLWKKCQEYGRVIDVYIPNRRTKSGDRFGFVHFIHIKDVDRLVKNLCTLWMGRLRLHANVARFQRPPLNKSQHVKGANVGQKSFGVSSNSKELLEEFKSHVGVGSWFSSLDKRICTKTKMEQNIFETFKIIIKGKVFWIRAKEVSGWIPYFLDEDEEDEEEDESDEDFEMVPDTIFSPIQEESKHDNKSNFEEGEIQSEDPFHIHDLLVKKPKNDNKEEESSKATLKYSLGFTPDDMLSSKMFKMGVTHSKEEDKESFCSGQFRRSVGLAQKAKKDWVKELCNKNKVNFLSLQETKMESINTFCVKKCWGNYSFEFVYGPSVGNSCAILCTWDPRMFHKHNATILDYFVAIQGEWIANAKKYLVISVYAPQEASEKRMLWSYLNHMIDRWNGESILMGDFNEARHKEERFGSVFNNHNAMVFNSFVSSSGLVEVPLGGCAFTRCYKSGSKMSKLDRFFISEGIMGFCPNITSITFDRYLSDHRPIILREVCHDYGPIPFRMYHYWFDWDGFDRFIVDTWSNMSISDTNAISKFMKKLRHLKLQTRLWVRDKKVSATTKKAQLKGMLKDIDILIDEKKKRNQHAIRGILSEGNWIEDPNLVKNEFFSHFKERFDNPCSSRLMLEREFPNKLSADQSIDLESNVTIEEIKRAVWDCGIDKSPGPDGFTFVFYRRYWDIIKKDVADAVSFFFISGNFLKAYDLVRWDYLDDVLNKFGFGSKWKNWIHNCLNSSKGSIMVNKSPTGEFHFRKGLKQGDPLSSFLFLLIMESLHLSFQNLVNEGEWSVSNINTLVQDLDCFYKASGLRMNLQKSKLTGIYVEDKIASRAASRMGCCTLTTPFLYLGVKVGGSMSRIKPWDEIEAKLHSCLSKWNMKTLSSGDIRRNFFIGADVKEKNMSWFKWSRVLASKDKGGLGVSSFFALNRALLFKWMWRFFNDKDALWSRFIRAVHGNSGGIETYSRVSYSSTWLSIVNEVNKMRNKGIDLLKYMKIQVGNGLNTKFWEDVWMGNKNFKTLFPRIYALESDKNLTVADKTTHNDTAFSLRRQPMDDVEMEQFRALSIVIEGVLLHDMVDRWKWTLEGWASSLLCRLESLLTIVG
nr:RNA-directed DNA polymerase, eukaryota [Tanacetum cinerariifolium]